jgi:hypothetical protein
VCLLAWANGEDSIDTQAAAEVVAEVLVRLRLTLIALAKTKR